MMEVKLVLLTTAKELLRLPGEQLVLIAVIIRDLPAHGV
jgi:hypothetical protein